MAGYRGGFGGGFGGGNQMQNLARQMQKAQEELQRKQEELDELEVEGVAGNGLVKVVMNAKKAIKAITIDPNGIDAEDITFTEDLIIAAINDGYEKADKVAAEKLGAFASINSMGLF